MFASTTTATEDDRDGVWHATQPNTTTTEQLQHSNNKNHDAMWNMFNYQTDMVNDDDDDYSSSINNIEALACGNMFKVNNHIAKI